MVDVQSIVIYIGVAFLTFVLAKFAQRNNSRRAVWTIVILLSLIAGLRSVTVGVDTNTYEAIFSRISDGDFARIYGIEKSFIYICAGLLRIWDNHQFLFFVFAFMSHGLLVFRIWKEREFLSFQWSVLVYYIVFFPFSFNGMRQFVAVAIIMYATGFIKDGKYWRFLILVLAASLFHTSALIGIAYLLFEVLFARYFDSKRKLRIYLLGTFMVVLGISFLSILWNRYIGYFDKKLTSVGVMIIAKIIMMIFAVVVMRKPTDQKNQYVWVSFRWYYFIGLMLNSLSYLFLYMGRIGLYFYVFEVFYIGYIFKSPARSKLVTLLKCGYIVLIMYYFYINLTSGTQGELPYRFFWQN